MYTDEMKHSVAWALGGITKISSEPSDIELSCTLKRATNGFCYLKIPDKVTESFLELIKLIAPGAHVPVSSGDHDNIGPHISVIHKKEMDTSDLSELGENFKFTIIGLDKIDDPDGWEEVKTCYTIRCDSKDLEDLRAKYNLSRKYKGHNFHITIAVLDR